MKPKDDEILAGIISSLEAQSNKKIENIHVSDFDRTPDDVLEALIVFTDGSRLDAKITVQVVNEKLAVRIQGNYI